MPPLPCLGFLLLTLLLATGPASRADAGVIADDCSHPFDVYTASADTKHACGVQDFARRSVTREADGTTDYTYYVAGARTTYQVPPPGFNALTADPSERAKFGIPQEPLSNTSAHDAWVQQMRKLHFVAPPQTISTIRVKSIRVSGATSNPNWSGWMDTGGGYQEAYGVWNEPTDHGTSCSGNSAVFWAGLGGFNVSQLAQDGTAINTGGLGQHQAWSEVLPTQQYIVPQNLYATAGGGFFADVYLDSGSGSNATFGFYMNNHVTGAALSYKVTADGYNGSPAEVVAERPSYSSGLPPLTNFGTFQVTGSNLDGYSDTALNMVNGSNLLATPSSLVGTGTGPGSFNVYWKRCL